MPKVSTIILPDSTEIAPLLTLEELETYLRTAPATLRFYDNEQHPHLHCPIAKAAQAKNPEEAIIVGGAFWVGSCHNEGHSYEMPKDVAAFVRAADAWFQKHHRPMRRFEAVRVLESVKKQLCAAE